MLYQAELRRRGPAQVSARRVEWNQYSVTGQVVFCGRRVWVLDIGLPVVSQRHWRDVAPGVVLSGDVWLASMTAGVWGEDLFERPAPPLDCAWQVERIWLNSTPWIETSPGSWGRASVEPAFAEIERSDYARDDDGRGDYVLDCRLVALPQD